MRLILPGVQKYFSYIKLPAVYVEKSAFTDHLNSNFCPLSHVLPWDL